MLYFAIDGHVMPPAEKKPLKVSSERITDLTESQWQFYMDNREATIEEVLNEQLEPELNYPEFTKDQKKKIVKNHWANFLIQYYTEAEQRHLSTIVTRQLASGTMTSKAITVLGIIESGIDYIINPVSGVYSKIDAEEDYQLDFSFINFPTEHTYEDCVAEFTG